MNTKQCTKCKQTKSTSEFNKDRTTEDGFHVHCKTCKKIYQISHRKTKKGKAIRKRYKQSEKCKVTEKLYHQSENGKARDKRFFTNHPNQVKSVSAINNAIRDSKLIAAKFLLCHCCPKPAQEYHHWHGYAPEQWLDVIPVCKDCHRKYHRKIA